MAKRQVVLLMLFHLHDNNTASKAGKALSKTSYRCSPNTNISKAVGEK